MKRLLSLTILLGLTLSTETIAATDEGEGAGGAGIPESIPTCHVVNTYVLGSLINSNPDWDSQTNHDVAYYSYLTCLAGAESDARIGQCNTRYSNASNNTSSGRFGWGNQSGNTIEIREVEQIVCPNI